MTLQEALTKILGAIYGRDVRQAIHDGIKIANDIASANAAAQKDLEAKFGGVYVYRSKISTGALADYTLAGSYNVLSDTITDLPPGMTGGSLFNITGTGALSTTTLQLFFAPGAKKFALRTLLADKTVFVDWLVFTADGYDKNQYSYRKRITTGKLSDYRQAGSYNFSSPNTITDLPDTIGGGVLYNIMGTGANADGVMQLAIAGSGTMATRSLLPDGTVFADWKVYYSGLQSGGTGDTPGSGSTTPSNTVWYSLGDSIESGSYSYFDDTGAVKSVAQTGEGWLEMIAEKKGYANHVNLARPGAGWKTDSNGNAANSFISHVTNSDFAGATLVTIGMYSNDMSGLQEGTIDEVNQDTMYGILNWGIQEIARKAPQATIILMGETRQNSDPHFANTARGLAIARKYRLKFIDLQTEAPVPTLSYAQMYPDGAHPSLECQKLMAAFVSPMMPD